MVSDAVRCSADIFVVNGDIDRAIETLRRRSYDVRETLRRRKLIGGKPSRKRRMKRYYYTWDPYLVHGELRHWPLTETGDTVDNLAPNARWLLELIRDDRERSPVERVEVLPRSRSKT